MVMEQVRNHTTCELPIDEIRQIAPSITWSTPPIITPDLSPIAVCNLVGEWYRTNTGETQRHATGQFFTPPPVARFMANNAGILHDGMRILDPGAGTGMLSCAICELAILQKVPCLSVVIYESDPVLNLLCSFTLHYAQEQLQQQGITLTYEVHRQDFIEAMAEQLTQTSLWTHGHQPQTPFDLVILNPPYFKVNQNDLRAKLIKDIAQGSTNMYTLFMSLAASSLRAGGRFISITPRSFSSGAYFKHFRRQFFDTITLELIHIFDSRRSAFEDADVLQENIILVGNRKSIASSPSTTIALSQSQGLHDLASPLVQQKPRHLILDEQQKDPVLHIPTSDIDSHLLHVFKQWHHRLATLGLEISTGPVVPFRASAMLTVTEQVHQNNAVPLLWLQHVHRMNIQWPIERFQKPQAMLLQAGSNLPVKNTTLVLLRRFSAKEEPRRVTAAVLPANAFGTAFIGLENHLNYLYRTDSPLSFEEATGIAAFLNSTLVDRYFRIASGNTQVSATELRKLPLPSWEQLIATGKRVSSLPAPDTEAIEHIIMDGLQQDLIIGDQENDLQLPIFHDSRITMGKIQEAQRILQDLGLPLAQQNEISALTLLALGNIAETTSWTQITQQPVTIHNMMGFMKQFYGRAYAENTREVVRRQVIHQFEQARIVDRNPDDHSRPTNSPNTCYALTNSILKALQQFDTPEWQNAVTNFVEQYGALWEQYQQSRQAIALPLKLADGSQFYFTPGKHNELQIAIIEKFGARFAGDATILYMGDTASKFVIFEREKLEQLGVPITTHDKLPDIILYHIKRNWLYLIEAVTSHGPVSHKRKYELELLLQDSSAKRIYISAFLHSAEFRRHAEHIAWETHVWIAERPEHMIHFNGDRLMEPYE